MLGRIYHPSAGCMAGWMSMTVGFAAPLALTAMGFAAHLRALLPWVHERFAAAGLLAVVTLVHARSLALGSCFQNVFTILKLGLLLGFIGAGFWAAPVTSLAPAAGDLKLVGSSSFALCLVYSMYSYSGWNAAAYIVGELQTPRRTLTRATAIGTIGVTLLFVATNAVFLRTNALETLRGKLEIGVLTGTTIFGAAGAKLISALIALGLVSCASAMAWTGPRVTEALGAQIPGLNFLSAKTESGIPLRALWLQLAVALFLLLSNSFEVVIAYTQFSLGCCSLLTVIGVFVLRWRQPQLERPYRVWGYPFTPLLFVGISLLTLWHLAWQRPFESTVGLATMGAGLGLYLLSSRRASAILTARRQT